MLLNNHYCQTLITILILLLVMVMPVKAEIFKWVDKNGKTHYGDEAPKNNDLDTKKVTVEPAPPYSETHRNTLKEIEAQAELYTQQQQAQREVEITKRKIQAAENKHRAKVCMDAMKQFDVLSQQAPVYHDANGKLRVRWSNDPYDGEFYYVDDAERERLINETNATIYSNCENPDDPEAQKEATRQQTLDEDCEHATAKYQVAIKPNQRSSSRYIEKLKKQADEICSSRL